MYGVRQVGIISRLTNYEIDICSHKVSVTTYLYQLHETVIFF